MKCPACQHPLPPGAGSCPACQFTLDGLKTKFGAIPRYNTYVTDTTYEVLTRRETVRLQKLLVFFERKFPQMRFSILLTRLLPDHPIGEYTFYLLNRCQFSPFQAKLERNFSLLLVLDPFRGEACLATGYGLENILAEEDLETILASANARFAQGQWYPGFKASVLQAIKVLRQSVTQGVRDGRRVDPAEVSAPPLGEGGGLQ